MPLPFPLHILLQCRAIDPSNLTPSMKRQWHQGQAHKNDTATASSASGISVGPNDYGPVIELYVR